MAKRMSTVSVSLPKSMHEFVAERVAEGGFADAGEYLRHLVRQDREREGEALRSLIAQGLSSGPAVEITPARRAAMRERLTGKPARRKTSA